jgi:hypothetical protein
MVSRSIRSIGWIRNIRSGAFTSTLQASSATHGGAFISIIINEGLFTCKADKAVALHPCLCYTRLQDTAWFNYIEF